MAITAAMSFVQACLDGGLDAIDGGSGDASGDFVLKSGAAAILATLPFSTTAFAASTDGGSVATATSNTITASGTPTAGTVASGAFTNKANTELLAFTITASGGGGDMIVSSVTIDASATSVTSDGVTVTLALA